MSAHPLALALEARMGDNGHHEALSAPHEADLTKDDARAQEARSRGSADRLAELIARGREGDRAAFESLYGMFKGPVFGLVYRHTLNRAAAEDIVQDVFLKVFTHLKDVREAGTFAAWVYRIALNACYSHLRRKRTQDDRNVPLDEIEGGLHDERRKAVENDLQGPLEEALAALAPRLRSVFVLHDVQGFKHEEIARTLGCSVGTSKSQLFKARMRMREHLRRAKAV